MRHGNVRRGAANTKVPSETAVIDSGTGYAGSVLKTILASGGNWQRDEVNISGATATTYTMTFADEGHRISYLAPGGVRSNVIEMFMPNDIANLTLWIDAMNTAGITFGTGSLVAGIASRVGSLSFAQATAGSQPSHSNTGRNGKPAFIMTTGKRMALNTPAAMPSGTGASHTFGLAYMSTAALNFRAYLGWGSGNTGGGYRAFGKNNSGNRVFTIGPNAELLSDPAVTYLDTDRIIACNHKNGGTELMVDGQYLTTDALNVSTGTPSYCNFGCGRNDDPRQMEGAVQEFMVYSASLSAADRQRCEGYLAHRWGELGRLPTGHPYKVAAPRIS